ncbi:hypothetical protein ABZP36_004506 [Zizania latifolia]
MASRSKGLSALAVIAALLSPGLSTRLISLPADHRPVTEPPLADGLAYDLYSDSCPQLETIVRSSVQTALQQEIALAAGLLRIFFHDCFPQGCDASLLLTGDDSEQQQPPNQTLQPRALQLIEDIRAKIKEKGKKRSTADSLTELHSAGKFSSKWQTANVFERPGYDRNYNFSSKTIVGSAVVHMADMETGQFINVEVNFPVAMQK